MPKIGRMLIKMPDWPVFTGFPSKHEIIVIEKKPSDILYSSKIDPEGGLHTLKNVTRGKAERERTVSIPGHYGKTVDGMVRVPRHDINDLVVHFCQSCLALVCDIFRVTSLGCGPEES